jgi:hypothetical protein
MVCRDGDLHAATREEAFAEVAPWLLPITRYLARELFPLLRADLQDACQLNRRRN